MSQKTSFKAGKLAAGFLLSTLSTLTFASSPLGTWKTVDDESGEAQSYVTIFEDNGTLSGKITKLLNPESKNDVCDQCEGELKDQKIEGMTILWGMEKQGSKYDDGQIVDPESGKIYSANMKVIDDGEKLEVHGYIGFALIGWSLADLAAC